MDETTYAPATEVEKAVFRVIAADRYARETDPHADAESEHADELLAHACRDLVDAVYTGDPREWPVGWACGEVGTRFPEDTEPIDTAPCRLRPDHEEAHDWAAAEDAAEAQRIALATLRTQAAAAAAYRAALISARDGVNQTDRAWHAGRAVMIRRLTTDLAERAGLRVPDWEQIEQEVPGWDAVPVPDQTDAEVPA
ncbi:hypothetical protein [Verrucosispora sp. WMMC514]|uniref:hypothetical protein n=1 Tax=Verrucosispora sp. WMMC514 TaxID=3015156 RepID=UPI00248AF260|nr:hypothetical protein [Verrucosispora sp. WMMC514]WBB94248.1 hypothetical protein O7597_15465 [Verrucosispora sp. WMMC514]